jgi:hypothetical protein
MRRALVAEPGVRFSAKALAEPHRYARFAYSGLARNQYDLAITSPRRILAVKQQTNLFLAADEIGQA